MNTLQRSFITVSQHYGTPTFLFDAETIQKKYQQVRNQLTNSCDIHYSIKANPSLAICEYLKKLGANCEVSSENELLTALKAGYLPDQIIFVGPAKKPHEIACAIQYKIKSIICESIDEVIFIHEIAKKNKCMMSVLLRINPDFAIDNAPIKMSGVATQFGMDVNVIVKNFHTINALPFISIDGFQVYNASRVLDIQSIEKNIAQILDLANVLSKCLDVEWKTIDVGGGFGVPYFHNEIEIDINTLIQHINMLFYKYNAQYPNTKFILELGRFLVAESGYLIATVQSIKQSHQKSYIVVDAGMHCHMAATGLGSFVHRNFPAQLISLSSGKHCESKTYQVAGPLCTPGDILLRDVEFPCVEVGDLIVISNTGAYGISASPGRFLSHGCPAEVLSINNQFQLIRRRETVHDLWATQSGLHFNSLKRSVTC